MLVALEKAHRDKWGTQEALLATIAEQVNLLWRQYVRFHSPEGADQPKPLEILRPGQTPKKRKGGGLSALAAALGNSRRR